MIIRNINALLTTNIGTFRSSAGTIRAVPDTVQKVPGLAPVLFLDTILYFRLKADTILTSLSTLKKALKFLLDPQTDFESFNTKRNFFKSIV